MPSIEIAVLSATQCLAQRLRIRFKSLVNERVDVYGGFFFGELDRFFDKHRRFVRISDNAAGRMLITIDYQYYDPPIPYGAKGLLIGGIIPYIKRYGARAVDMQSFQQMQQGRIKILPFRLPNIPPLDFCLLIFGAL